MTNTTIIKVGMADLKTGICGEVLKTTGLGSCVGITLFDPEAKVGGMAHVMLPSSDIAREGKRNDAKYADTAIPLLISKMIERGASLSRMEAKLAGGAQMFAIASANEMMRIGSRNAEASRQVLMEYGIPIKAEDLGGNYGRTIELDCCSGSLLVRSIHFGVKEL